MGNTISIGRQLAWLPVLAVAVVAFAVFLRFSHLGDKLYWSDEVFTSLRISGYTAQEYRSEIFRNQPLPVTQLWRFQTVQPDKGLLDTVRGLAIDEAQLPPLYYVLVRGWAGLFGSSEAVVRSLSVLFGVLLFPALWWLGRELSGSRVASWVTLAVVAASPFHLLYAQEARPYALWTLLTVAASAALLRAVRLGGKAHWAIYALLAALNLWAYLFSLFVLAAHGLYIFATDKFRFGGRVRSWAIAAALAAVSFGPWLWTIAVNLSNVRATTSWTAREVGVAGLTDLWGRNLSLLFFDWQPGVAPAIINSDPIVAPIAILVAALLVGWSFWTLVRQAPREVWLFIVLLTGVTFLVLALPDVLMGGRRSGIMRYTIPACLGVQLAVGFALARAIEKPAGPGRFVAEIALVALTALGLLSSVRFVQSEVWWNKLWTGSDFHTQRTAALVNRSPRPLVVGEDDPITFSLMLANVHLFDARVQLLPVHGAPPPLPEGYSDIFVLNPSDDLKAHLSRRYRLEPEFAPGKLWRVAE